MTTAQSTRSTAETTVRDGLLDRVKIYLARSQAEKRLSMLDDRMLADIGLKRGEIHSKVWG